MLNVNSKTPITHVSVFEINNGALELTREPMYRPRTKHENSFIFLIILKLNLIDLF